MNDDLNKKIEFDSEKFKINAIAKKWLKQIFKSLDDFFIQSLMNTTIFLMILDMKA